MTDIEGDNFPITQWTDAVLSERSSISVIGKAFMTARGVMILDIQQANRIINALYELDCFEYTDFSYRISYHLAWHASGQWPNHITEPQEDKLSPARHEMIQQHGGYDGPDLIPKLQELYRLNVAGILDKDKADAAWTESDLQTARKLATEAPGVSASAASVEIARDLDMHDVADELMREQIIPHLLDSSDLKTKHTVLWDSALESPQIWELLADGRARKAANISEKRLTDFVDRVIELLEQRLRNGPLREYRSRSISELVHIFNDTCVEKKSLGGMGASFQGQTNVDDDNYWKMPDTFLKPPATEEEIDELEARARDTGNYPDGLPSEYKEFLLVSNGIYVGDEKARPDNILRPTDAIELEDLNVDWQIELLPHSPLLGCNFEVTFRWPPIPANVLNIGSGGDEGYTWLVCGEPLRRAIEVFDETWKKAGKDDRKRIERTVNDLHGSVERLRGLDCVVMRWYHWFHRMECMGSFRDFLELNVAEIMRREKDDDDEEEGQQDNEDEDAESRAGARDTADDDQTVGDEGHQETALSKRSRPQSQDAATTRSRKSSRTT